MMENTTYVGDVNRGAAGGGQFTTIVIKHNCLYPGLYCDPTPPNYEEIGPICQSTKKLGQTCRFDAECELVSVLPGALFTHTFLGCGVETDDSLAKLCQLQ